jgi:hypothetical protein
MLRQRLLFIGPDLLFWHEWTKILYQRWWHMLRQQLLREGSDLLYRHEWAKILY